MTESEQSYIFKPSYKTIITLLTLLSKDLRSLIRID